MSNENLRNKWRPQTFEEVVGQTAVVNTLKAHVANNKALSTHYLIVGPYGTGKTTIGKILAKAMMCPNRPEGETGGCEDCETCRGVSEGFATDYEELNAGAFEDATVVKKKIKDAQFFPMGNAKCKVWIIDECHKLTKGMAEALLQLLEMENLPTRFIFLTTEQHKILETIKSRLDYFELSLIDQYEVKRQLIKICKSENFTYEDRALDLIVSRSRGHLRNAVGALNTYAANLTYKELLDKMGESEEVYVEHFLKAIKMGVTTVQELVIKFNSEARTDRSENEATIKLERKQGEYITEKLRTDRQFILLAEAVMNYVGLAILNVPGKNNCGFGTEQLLTIFKTFDNLRTEFNTGGGQWVRLLGALMELARAYERKTLGSESFYVSAKQRDQALQIGKVKDEKSELDALYAGAKKKVN